MVSSAETVVIVLTLINKGKYIIKWRRVYEGKNKKESGKLK